MGAWGPGIFADDDAIDVRDDYRWYLADAQSDEGATDAIAKSYGASFDDLGATTAFWLALALTQWKMGRLDPRVKVAALRIIDEGIDLQKWDGSKLRGKRAAALAKAREKISSPQPPARPMPKPLPVQLPGWQFGEVVGVRARNGRLVLLHMICYRRWTSLKVKAPVVSFLNWVASEPPTEQQLSTLTYINWRKLGKFEIRGNHLCCLASPRSKPIPESRFIHLGLFKPVTQGEAKSPYIGIDDRDGRTLDTILEGVLQPYWDDPTLSPHRPGFDQEKKTEG